MPLTLTQFLLSIPLSIAVLFSPFLLVALFKRRPLKPLFLVYAAISLLLIAFFYLLSLFEHLNR